MKDIDMYKFPFVLCLVLFFMSCAITMAENLVLNNAVLDEMPTAVTGPDTFVKQLYIDEKKDFDIKVSQKKNNNPKVPLHKWKKTAPSPETQKDGIVVVD